MVGSPLPVEENPVSGRPEHLVRNQGKRMNAIVLILGSIGFGCAPASPTPVTLPWLGPIEMPMAIAEELVGQNDKRFLMVVREDAPGYRQLVRSCTRIMSWGYNGDQP